MSISYAIEPRSAHLAATTAGDLLDRMGVRMAFAKDEEVYGQDEDADLIYRVVSGAVRTSRVMSDGRRQIGDFYYPGDLFGLEPGPEHRFSAEALCDCVVLVLKRTALKAAGGEAELANLIMEATMRELQRTQEHLLLLGRKTACEKVATFLSELADRRDADTVDMPMCRQDMADYLGLTIETVSRMLSQLQGASIVEFKGCRQFRIRNHDALARLAA